MNRTDLARAAFYGLNEPLMDHLYEMDGQLTIDTPPTATLTMDLSRAIELMETHTDEQLAELAALGIIDQPAPALPVAEDANHDTPCPLGCGRRVSTEGDEIHYCVTRNADGSTSREYVGTWDGAAMFYGACHDEVERQLRPYREEIKASELVIAASLLDGGDPEHVALVEPDPGPPVDDGPADNWGGFRHPITMDRVVEWAYAMRHVPLADEERYRHRIPIEPPPPDDEPACPDCKPGRPCYDHEPTWAKRWIVDPPKEDDEPAAEFFAQAQPTPTCGACGGPHHIQQCPEIHTLLMPGPLPAPRKCPSCGDAWAQPGLYAACREVGDYSPGDEFGGFRQPAMVG